MNISKNSQESIVQFARNARDAFMRSGDQRDAMERVDREYARQGNLTKEHIQNERKNESGNKRVIQDVTVPILYPQSETAHAYLCGVFLTGHPLFPTVASPENADAGDQMDAINEQHQVKAHWVKNLSMCLRDSLKYNLCAAEVFWETRKTYGLQRTQDGYESRPTSWEGNCIKRLDLYNTFYDQRVAPSEVHLHGEYAGYHEILGRIQMKQLIADLPEEYRLQNAKEVLESRPRDNCFFVPDITNKQRPDPRQDDFNWHNWMTNQTDRSGVRIDYANSYEVTVIYARVCPEDFGLRVPSPATPQIWKFIIVNSAVLLYAERMTNVHNYLGIVFGVPHEDGLRQQTLSFCENLISSQDMASSLWNVRLASARRSVSDRTIYNPEFISSADINSANPSAKIPIRPNRYLDDIRKAVYAFPYDGNAANNVIPDANAIMEFSRSLSGISRPQEGMLTKGNRTLGEYQDVRNNADARLQIMALCLESQFFTAIKEIIKYNVLQYVKSDSVYVSSKRQRIQINPQALNDAALDFRMSDGLLPSSKLADSEFLISFMQMVGNNPLLAQQFDLASLVSYLASLRNVPNLDAFKIGISNAPPQNQQNAGTPNQTNGGGLPSATPAGPAPV